MPDELDKINEIFRIHDDRSHTDDQAERHRKRQNSVHKNPIKAMDELLIDS